MSLADDGAAFRERESTSNRLPAQQWQIVSPTPRCRGAAMVASNTGGERVPDTGSGGGGVEREGLVAVLHTGGEESMPDTWGEGSLEYRGGREHARYRAPGLTAWRGRGEAASWSGSAVAAG